MGLHFFLLAFLLEEGLAVFQIAVHPLGRFVKSTVGQGCR